MLMAKAQSMIGDVMKEIVACRNAVLKLFDLYSTMQIADMMRRPSGMADLRKATSWSMLLSSGWVPVWDGLGEVEMRAVTNCFGKPEIVSGGREQSEKGVGVASTRLGMSPVA